jgi:FG-GAP repeat
VLLEKSKGEVMKMQGGRTQTRHNVLVFILFVFVGLMAGCNPYGLPKPAEELEPLFTDADIDRATVSSAKTVRLLEGGDTGSLPEGLELPPLPDVQSDVTAQVVLANTDGFIYSINNDPNATNPWRIVRHNQVTDERVNVLVTKREIQSVAGSLDGNIVLVAMRQTTTSSSDFEIFRLNVSGTTTQNLSNDTVDNIHVGVSADGLKVVWQHLVGTQETVFLRTYLNQTTTSSFTEVALGGTTSSQLQPSISGNGRFIVLIRDGLVDTVQRFDTVTNTYLEIVSAFTIQSLKHPSVSDDGNKVAWLFGQRPVGAVRVKNLLDNTTQDVVNALNGDIEHPFITSDGNFLSYALKQDSTFKLHIKNLSTGLVRRSTNPTVPIAHTGSMWQKIPPFGHETKLVAPTSAPEDEMGSSVAVDGNTLVACAQGEDNNQGACHVFTQSVGVWTFVKKLQASDAANFDFFGSSVALSGNTIVVGAANEQHNADGVAGDERNVGAAYVFLRNNGGTNNWGQAKKLIASDDETFDNFGGSVAVDGDFIIVGASGKKIGTNFFQGSAYIFLRNQGGTNRWGEIKQLFQSDQGAGDNFGRSVAIDNTTVVVGASGKSAAYIFEKDSSSTDAWGEVKKLSGVGGFGNSVALEANTLAVGAASESPSGTVSLFERNQDGTNAWGLVKKVSSSQPTGQDSFGNEVSLKGDTLVVGAPFADVDLDGNGVIDCLDFTDTECRAGAAFIFQRTIGGSNAWGELRRFSSSDVGLGDFFGTGVAAGNDFVAVGLRGRIDDDGSLNDSGAVYIYK